jgi:hypothetical protein
VYLYHDSQALHLARFRSDAQKASKAKSRTPTMFYDLNVPYTANDAHLPRTLAFLSELGYGVVALNHTIAGKLPSPAVGDMSNLSPNVQ